MGNTKSKGRFSGNTKFEQTFKKIKNKKNEDIYLGKLLLEHILSQ